MMDDDDAPVYMVDRLSSTEAVVKPEKMEPAERVRTEEAARRVRKLFPGAVGEFLAVELDSWTRLSLRLDGKGITNRMIDEVLAAPIPEDKKPDV